MGEVVRLPRDGISQSLLLDGKVFEVIAAGSNHAGRLFLRSRDLKKLEAEEPGDLDRELGISYDELIDLRDFLNEVLPVSA